jgi:hypothetical protein
MILLFITFCVFVLGLYFEPSRLVDALRLCELETLLTQVRTTFKGEKSITEEAWTKKGER